MQQIKLIALDLDGTLLKDNQEISATNRQWIKKAEQAGITVCFATGRGRSSSEQYWDVVQPTAPMVVVNGSEIWENHEKLLARYTMPTRRLSELYALALKHDTWYWGHTLEGIVRKEDWTLEKMENSEWLKFGFSHLDLEIIEEIRQTVRAWGEYGVTSSQPTNVEVGPKGVSKASALAQVAQLLNIDSSEVAVMGDSQNDLEMIQWAGFGAAMGNAEDEVKELADYITGTNEEDGVAQVIQLLLK